MPKIRSTLVHKTHRVVPKIKSILVKKTHEAVPKIKSIFVNKTPRVVPEIRSILVKKTQDCAKNKIISCENNAIVFERQGTMSKVVSLTKSRPSETFSYKLSNWSISSAKCIKHNDVSILVANSILMLFIGLYACTNVFKWNSPTLIQW